jgi:hypothetical protein
MPFAFFTVHFSCLELLVCVLALLLASTPMLTKHSNHHIMQSCCISLLLQLPGAAGVCAGAAAGEQHLQRGSAGCTAVRVTCCD